LGQLIDEAIQVKVFEFSGITAVLLDNVESTQQLPETIEIKPISVQEAEVIVPSIYNELAGEKERLKAPNNQIKGDGKCGYSG